MTTGCDAGGGVGERQGSVWLLALPLITHCAAQMTRTE